MFIRVFVVAITVAALWWSSSSFGLGLGLGELNVTSNLASPLKASVTLRGMDGIDLNPEHFSIRIDSDSNSKIEYRLQRMDADTAVIDLYTREILSDPLFQFRIEVKWDNSAVSRSYDVLIDPPGYKEFLRSDDSSVTAEASTPGVDNGAEQEALPVQKPIVLSNVELGGSEYSHVEVVDSETTETAVVEWSADEPAERIASNDTLELRREYGPTINGNSIWRVARAVATDNRELTIYQWMYAIWNANPQAFTRGNMHRLKMYEVLSIPLEDEVAATVHLTAWRAYSNQMSMLQANSPASAITAVDVSVDTEQQVVSQKESTHEVATHEVVEQQAVQNVSNNLTLVEDNPLVASEEFEASAVDNSMIAVLENSTSLIDQESEVSRVNEPAIEAPQSTLLTTPRTEVETQQTVAANDLVKAPLVETRQLDQASSPDDVSNEVSDVRNFLDAESADNMMSTNVVQKEVTADIDSIANAAPDPGLNEWSAALLSRNEYIDQLPMIGTGGILAFVGRGAQHVDRYIATRPSWATLALGVWVTLILMMLRQQLLTRRTASSTTNLQTTDLISRVMASVAKRRKSATHRSVQSAPKPTNQVQQELTSSEHVESTKRAVSESEPLNRESTSNAPEIIAQANAILSKGDIEEAIKLMRLAVVLQPNQSSLVMLLLELYHKTGRAVFFAELFERSRSVLEMLEVSDQNRLRPMHAQLCPDLPFEFKPGETTDIDEPSGGDFSGVNSEPDPDTSHIEGDRDDETFLETQVIFTNNGIPLRDEASSLSGIVGENIDLDVILKEADVYLAYGLYDSAEELLLKGMEVDPGRADFLARLLDSYFATRNVVNFVSCAEVLLDMGDGGGKYWDKVEIMGYQLAPYNQLFAGGKDRELKIKELEIARPQTADFDFSDIVETDNVDFTDIEIAESSETTPADIDIHENEDDNPDLNLGFETGESGYPVDDDTDDLDSDIDSDLDSDLDHLLDSEESGSADDFAASDYDETIVVEATDGDLDTVLREPLVAAQDAQETLPNLDIADDDEVINLEFEEEGVRQFTKDDDVDPEQETLTDDDNANLVLVEETTLDSPTNVNLDSSNSRILHFPDSHSENKGNDEFESETKMTLQAIRDQLQNMTERLFHQERETRELQKTILEMSDDSPKASRKENKKSS